MALDITLPGSGTPATAPGSFVQRQLRIAVKLGQNSGTTQPSTFAKGGDTITLPALRASVRVQNSGAPMEQSALVSVWGLKFQLMQQLSTLGMRVNMTGRDTVTVQAGDPTAGFVVVFSGVIVQAYADFGSMPDVPMIFECQWGLEWATQPAVALSYTGPTNVATIMKQIADKMGVGFENNGINVKLSNPYLPGSLLTQMRSAAEQAGISANIINGETLVICPKFGGRQTADIPLIAEETGMIGYPAYTPQGILVRTLFNPKIKFLGKVSVRTSILKQAEYQVLKMDHFLDSQIPKGQWMSALHCYTENPLEPVLAPR